jgi:hypothetical protein
VVWGMVPFMATIAVPQRKKGAMSKIGLMALVSVSLICMGEAIGSRVPLYINGFLYLC